MARSRNIKPSFFVNDDLAAVSPLGRLLFIGLWTIADREGRLRDKPNKIKVQVLPYDDCDTDALLNDLQDQGFILRYATDSCPCIQILNFTKHQNPHVKEANSELPAPDGYSASTIQEQDFNSEDPADSLLLIPDSLKPIRAKYFTPPTYDEVNAYCKSRGNNIDAEAFIAFYGSKGWMVGSNKMKDWKQAVITWEKRKKNDTPTINKPAEHLTKADKEAMRREGLGL